MLLRPRACIRLEDLWLAFCWSGVYGLIKPGRISLVLGALSCETQGSRQLSLKRQTAKP